METFSDKTEVSFSQLFKKDGWFSRLIFIQLIALPIHTSIYSVFRPLRNTSDNLAHYFIFIIGSLFIAGHLMIGLLLWKKRTRSTITVSIALLWITFAVKRFLGLFGSVILLAGTLLNKEASNALITYRIYGLIYTVSLAVLFLALTIIWTRNLKRLKSLCP